MASHAEWRFTLPEKIDSRVVADHNLKMARSAHAYVRGSTVKF